MNKVYRVVWSVARQTWIVTSEHSGYGGGVPLLAAVLLLSGLPEPVVAANYNNETLEDTQSQNLFSGDTATSTTINNGGTQFISSGGLALSTVLNTGGIQYVSSGGSATASMVNSGGIQTVLSGGLATGTQVDGGTQTVQGGGSATSATVNTGTQTIQGGGLAISTTVNSGGGQYVSSGGSAVSTMVNMGGFQYVSGGGSATSTTVNSDGFQTVLSGGMVTGTLLNGGNQTVEGGAVVTSTIVNPGGFQTVSSGGRATLTQVDGGIQTIQNGGLATSTTVNSGTQTIQGGGSVLFTTVNSNGNQYVSSGGFATSTTVNSGGFQYVSGGGSATSTVVSAGGFQTVLNGGVVSDTLVDGGNQTIEDGGSVTSTTVRSNGFQTVFSGGRATGTLVDGSTQTIRDGGSVTATTVNAGTQTILSGGLATSTTINVNATQYVSSGGSAFYTTVNAGGFQYVADGGLIAGTTINSGGTLSVSGSNIFSGNTTLYDGSILVGNSITNNGNLDFVLQHTSAWNGSLVGSGQLTKEGSGALTLGGTLQQSQVNLNAGSLILDGLEATASIVAQSGTSLSLVNSTTLTGSIDPTDVNIDQSSVWNITGDSLVDKLSNDGSIVFVPASGSFTAHTLTVTDLTGNSGTITLNTVAGNSSSLADKVVINGGRASGTTGLRVLNRGGLGAQTTGSGIAVIQAINGATTDAGAFSLKQPLTAGAYAYSLYRNADQSWYLTSLKVQQTDDDSTTPPAAVVTPPTSDSATPPPGAVTSATPPAEIVTRSVNYRDGMWSYAAMPLLSLDYDRLVAGTADTRFSYAPASRVWGRLAAGHLHHPDSGSLTGGSVPESNSAYSFLQLGGDLWRLDGDNADWRAGLYGATGLMRSDIWRDGGNNEAGTDRDTIYAGGAYLSGRTQSGLHADGVLQASHHSLSAASNDGTRLSTSGSGWLASAEVGQAFAATPTLALEPQLRYIVQGVSIDEQHDEAALLNWGSSRRQSVSAGLKTGTPDNAQVALAWWITPSVTQSYGGHSDVTASVPGVVDSDASFRSNLAGSSVGLSGGVTARIRPNATLSAQGGWSESLHGSEAGGYYGIVNVGILFR